MSFDCRRVNFDQCGSCGVNGGVATKGRLTNCQVTNCEGCGIHSQAYSTVEIEGEETRINNNCTLGDSLDYGLRAYSSSSSTGIIHLLSPLTKEDVSKNHMGGGANYSEFHFEDRKIETVNSF